MDQALGYALIALIVAAFVVYHGLLDWEQQEQALGWFWIILILFCVPIGMVLSYLQLGDPLAHF